MSTTKTYKNRNDFLEAIEGVVLHAMSEGVLKRARWGVFALTASPRQVILTVAGKRAARWTVVDGLAKANGLYEEAIALVTPKVEVGIEVFKASRLDAFAKEAA